MANSLVEFRTEDGGTILVEADEWTEGDPRFKGLRPGQIVEKAQDTFEEALAKIRPAVETVVERMRNLAQAPDTVTVEFGVKLSAAAGAVIASAASEANFRIALTWRRGEG
jgi:hypothetical protein